MQTKTKVKTEAKKKRKAEKTSASKSSVLVNFILDCSGSMDHTKEETISSFNGYVKSLATDTKADYRFTLTIFNSTIGISRVTTGCELCSVPELDALTYRPNGWTPLYDAIGITVDDVEVEARKHDKVLTVIMTDGLENKSTLYDKHRIETLIKDKEATGKWSFAFMGAGIEAWSAGVSLGIAPASTIRYDAGEEQLVGEALGAVTMSYASSKNTHTRSLFRGVTGQSVGFASAGNEITPEELEKWAKASKLSSK
jgi:uncharacterized protein YegL